jgi:hypothetical protein
MKNVKQDILNFFDERIAETKKKQEEDLKKLMDFIKGPELLIMSESIDKKWNSVVEDHKNRGPLKLIILGEAPLNLDKYFYNNQGTFLDSLRDHWDLKKNKDLPPKMLINRILILDIYKYPIPSEFYKKDKKRNVLLDEDYLNDKINLLIENNLIDEKTHFVFRYKQLFKDRELNKLKSFTKFNFISSNEEIVSFNTREKPQKLNDTVKDYLSNNCSNSV